MTRRRRALVLAGLATLLGGLAASDVARREAAVQQRLGPAVAVVVAGADIPAGSALGARTLAVRRVPARYAPSGSYGRPGLLVGARTAVPVDRGTDIVPELLRSGEEGQAPGAPVRPGERIAELVARGSPSLVRAGARVDVLVTRDGPDGTGGRTEIALEDAEVLAATAARAADSDPTAGPRVAVSLRVTLAQAVELAAAEQYAREVRVLPRAAGDRSRG